MQIRPTGEILGVGDTGLDLVQAPVDRDFRGVLRLPAWRSPGPEAGSIKPAPEPHA